MSPFGNVRFTFVADGVQRLITSERQLSKYQWHHIVATVNSKAGLAQIYVDGEIWALLPFQENLKLNSGGENIWIAQSAADEEFAGFSLNTLNGTIDELNVYADLLSEDTILAHYQSATIKEVPIPIDPTVRHQGDYLRPQYHPMPNTAWTNESYGLSYHKGKYHMFFQKNPNGPYLYFMHWGHVSSPDLVSWTEEPMALAPSEGFDDFGVWSGTTLKDKDGNWKIFYTGVDGVKAGIGSASPLDDSLITWQKDLANPLIAGAPGDIPNLDFRDPYLFEVDGTYYMVVGSGRVNNEGGILMSYKSTDLENWIPIPPIWESSFAEQNGFFWEMPTVFPIGEDTYLIQVTPLFEGQPANSIYWTGTFENERFVPHFQIGKTLELISENLLAPAFGQDEEGRWTYIGIIPEDRNVQLQIQAGWRQTFSIPRVIRLLSDGRTLGVIPHPNLCRLREDSVIISDQLISPGTTANLPQFQSTQAELVFKVDFLESQRIELEVFKNPGTGESVKIVLDKENSLITLDRRQSSPFFTVEDIRSSSYLFNPDNTANVRVFLDRSTLEVFVDNLISFSSRVYPAENGNQIDVTSTETACRLVSFKGYSLGSKEDVYTQKVCEPDNLPDSLFAAVSLPPANNQDILSFPNPVSSTLTVNDISPESSISIISIEGKRVELPLDGNQLDVSSLAEGIYIIELVSEGNRRWDRFIKQ
ncbi:MAG: GH32 C-terminal domain-containing protein [Bacteroidota bacterium]